MSDTEGSVDDPGVPLARNTGHEWQVIEVKRKRNSGEGYTSRMTGRHVAPRCVGAACGDGCFDTVTMPIINILHQQFWAIGDFGLQNAYIQKNVHLMPVKRRRSVQNPTAASRRNFTRMYKLTHASVTYSLCQKGFLAVLGISETRLRTALKAVSVTGCPRQDQRGRRKPGARRIPPEVAARAVEHILSFPTVSSHYTRAKSPYMRYLEGHLNVRKMYRLYLLWMEEHYPEEPRVKSSYYRMKFKGLRLGFRPPMSDTCSRCDTLKVAIKSASPDEVQGLRDKKKEHVKKAKEGQRLMKKLAKDTDDNTRCICLDLQQTLPVPRMSTSIAYYQKKLWMYNLCIHDLKKKVSQFFVWDEVNGGRGSSEIASCILLWLNSEWARGETFTVLKIVSDNCGGQNKNINLLLSYLRLIHSGRLANIEHYYLVPGHSYMACDRAFGNIEKTIRATGDVYDFRGYCLAIGASRVERQKVNVLRMGHFLNFDVLQKEVTVRRPQAPYKFMEARRFSLSSKFRQGYYVGMEYEGPLGTVRLRKGTAIKNPESFNLSRIDLPQKYSAPRLLKPGKVKCLRTLLSYIPPIHSRYLQFIIDQQEELVQGGNGHESDEGEEDVDGDLDEHLDYDEEADSGAGGMAVGALPSTSSQ